MNRDYLSVFLVNLFIKYYNAAKTLKVFKYKYAILFLLSFHILTTKTKAQLSQLRFKHYTTTDGLSQGSIYHMAQDSRGFMWFGTFDGLDRYDGYNFRVFRPDFNDSNSIKGGRINSIVEDKSGMLWVGTYEALNRYDFKTDRFEPFYVEDNAHQKLRVSYDPFFIDDRNELWFTYEFHDLGSINLTSGKITTYPFADGLLDEFVTGGYPENQFYRPLSKIYSVGSDGLHIIDIDNKKAQFYFSSNSKNQSGSKTLIVQVLEDKNHILWLASKNGLISLDPVTLRTQLYDKYNAIKKNIIVYRLAFDKEGNLWCGSYKNGLILFNTTIKKFCKNYVANPVNFESVRQNNIASLFIDRDQNIWLGIDPRGIDKTNPFYEQFNRVKINPQKKNEDYTSSIWSISGIDSNNMLICSNHEDLIIYNKIKDESVKFDLPKGFKGSEIFNAIFDSQKRIWIAADSGIFYSDNELKTIKLILKKSNKYNVCLLENNKRIFIGTGNGLFSLPMKGETNEAVAMHLFDGKGISTINKSPGGVLFVATENKELFLIEQDSINPQTAKKIVFDFLIKSIFFQNEDTVWFGTGSGLVRYVVSKNSLKIYTEKNGLANNLVYAIVKGNDGNLWMSTNHGISKFNLFTEEFSNYGLEEGTQALEFNSHSLFQSYSGVLYFGGVNGFNYFNPKKIKEFDFRPPLQLLNITVNGTSISLDRFLHQSKPVIFPANENNISIEFAALDFNRNDNINYLYKLHQDDAWISIGKRRTLNFANLSPGKYNVEVEAQYSYNEVSPNFLKLSFTVLPPFYETYWFIIVVCVVFILIVYSMYRYRVNEIKKLYAMRTNISQDLHDEIGSTLGSISIYSEVAKKLSVTNEKADEAISKIGSVSRELIDKMSDIVWSINPNNESFEQLQNRMQAFAAMMLTPHEIQFNFHSPGKGNSPVFSMQKRRNIYLIFKEAINNIVKYAECKTVNIDLSIRENNFCMLIKDDGKGFDPGSNSVFNGNGIKNMRSRSADMHAQLNIDSVINKGTVIKVTLKL